MIAKDSSGFSRATFVPGLARADGSSCSSRRSYFVRHITGELSLAVSFWVNYILVLVLMKLAMTALWSATELIGLKALALTRLIFFAASLLVWIWVVLGVWRAASSHTRNGGKRIWAILAKASILCFAFNIAGAFVFHVVPASAVMVRIVAGDSGNSKCSISVSESGEVISFRGGFRAGASREFERTIEAAPAAKVLIIESNGGRNHEAERIGALVRNSRLTTYVTGKCVSAGTLVFVCGKERIIGPEARLGFHRPTWRSSEFEKDQTESKMNTAFREFMENAGISPNFVDRILATSPDDMWYPSYEELLHAGVVTGKSPELETLLNRKRVINVNGCESEG